MIFIEKVLKTKYPDYQIMWNVLSLCIEKSKLYIFNNYLHYIIIIVLKKKKVI